MIKRKGIDVSAHQGLIDWEKVKNDGIEFAMIRVGYSTTEDKQFINNVKGCENNNIPYGFYLFSYALNVPEAIDEADFLLKRINLLNPTYPIAFDLEYDTIRYMKQMKVEPTRELINDITKAFCKRIEQANYYCMNYSNKDYFINMFDDEVKTKYDLWFAHWNVDKPFVKGGIWQYTSQGKVNGIQGNVDMNIAYKDYPTIIANMRKKPDTPVDWEAKYKELEKDYNSLIRDVETLLDLYKETQS